MNILISKMMIPTSILADKLETAMKSIELWIRRRCPAEYAPSLCPRNENSYHEWIRRELGHQIEIEDPEADYICPITFEIMNDPVIADDGHTYERYVIEGR